MQNIEEITTMTVKGQITVPKVVRSALALRQGDRLKFVVSGTQVTVARADEDSDDPALGPFLELVAADLIHAPHRLVPVTLAYANGLSALAESLRQRSGIVQNDDVIDGDVAL